MTTPKKLELTEIQKEVLIGCLLGDANLSTETQGRTWRLRMLHGEKQKDYIEAKYQIFKEFCGTGVSAYVTKPDTRTGKPSTRYSFNTLVYPCFRHYGNMFYGTDLIKKVPSNIHQLLTGRVLAYWFMDDGALKAANTLGVRFCSESFSVEDNERLSNALKDKFGLLVTVPKHRISRSLLPSLCVHEVQKPNAQNESESNRRLYISAKSYSTFKDLVYEYMKEHPTMLYKLPVV
jgi:hypothetical protein